MGGGSVEKGKLTLEEYTDFYNNVDRLRFNVDQLNQIVFMHGFTRIHRRHKVAILDALDAMELMDPRRSTLHERVSSDAPLTVEEVRADLEAIGWQGCHIVSLQNTGTVASSSVSATSSSSSGNVAEPCAGGGPAEKKRKKAAGGRKRSTVRKVDQSIGPEIPLLTYRFRRHSPLKSWKSRS